MTSGNNNIETEYLELNAKNDWPIYYQKIRAESTKNSGICGEAIKPQNKCLNRYRDVSPYDHSRIILQRGSTDYINANLIRIEKANRQYILTQGPLANTVSHFWLMVWEQNTKAVLMLNKLIEKKQEKCFRYWPGKIGAEHVMVMEDVGLQLEYLEQQDHSYYLSRVLRLSDIETGDKRDILQFHYTTWPDFGVPTSPTAFLEFLRKVRAAGVLEDDVGPAVVHCSAGIGRSGTFCLVDSCLVLIEKFGLNSVDVKEILLEMRKYRMGLIQTPEQLRFSYQAIIEGAKQLLNPTANSEEDNHLELSINDQEDLDEQHQQHNSSEDDDEPPPLPPPRLDSLKKQQQANGLPMAERPLPKIPNSVSLNDINDEPYIPSGPLPIVPAGEEEDEMSSEDELEEEEDDEDEEELLLRSDSPVSDTSRNSVSPSELRQRKRVERKEQMEAQVKDMKRRQQINEKWTQLKRSLYIPLVIGGTVFLGGTLIAYFYFKG